VINQLKSVVLSGMQRMGYTLVRTQASEYWSYPQTPSIVHSQVSPIATYSPWILDQEFQAVYQAVRHSTLVDLYRCYEVWSLARQLDEIQGDFLEVGVWRGGTGALLALAAMKGTSQKQVYLADTFEGVVKAGPDDPGYMGGEHSDTSADLVRQMLQSLGLINTTVLVGTFPEETGHLGPSRISLLHCDVDVYQSSKDVVGWALPRMPSGGIILFDDYGFYGCEGVTKFVHELVQDKQFTFLHNLNGHAILVKR
jgi:O-methyltransferase